ncbi:nucleotidyltransferase domain-containing protein [Kribbella italica]|uniref:Nucleotidyltransferase domain-containing protein n=1 Tax=Kribbella italica TaxID=1540520 RepID=A0A7W9J8W9_9ACTN|nr:nucleotidyltransferase domain-containing protein [Kribbella italica]MBB5837772.1 hypothetical protein [Kribbella italica]
MTAAEWRLRAVRPMLTAYAGTPGVDAAMVGGSTARGDADRWSDVEVGVFWSRPPSIQERRAIVAAADVRVVNEHGPPWHDHISLGAKSPDGLMVEVEHTLTSAVEQTLDEVLHDHKPDGPALGLLQGIVDGRELTGVRTDVVRRWQARAADYPRGLAIAVVESNGAIEKFWRLRMLTERENPLLLARESVRISNQLLNVLHALNGKYCGHVLAFKRLDTMERHLTIAPPHLAKRLRQVFATHDTEVLRSLVEETFDLLEIHLPEVNLERLRTTFRSERTPLEELPSDG